MPIVEQLIERGVSVHGWCDDLISRCVHGSGHLVLLLWVVHVSDAGDERGFRGLSFRAGYEAVYARDLTTQFANPCLSLMLAQPFEDQPLCIQYRLSASSLGAEL